MQIAIALKMSICQHVIVITDCYLSYIFKHDYYNFLCNITALNTLYRMAFNSMTLSVITSRRMATYRIIFKLLNSVISVILFSDILLSEMRHTDILFDLISLCSLQNGISKPVFVFKCQSSIPSDFSRLIF